MDEEFSIAKLDLKPGDTLVVRFNDRLASNDMVRAARSALSPSVPDGVKILVIGRDVDLSVMPAV